MIELDWMIINKIQKLDWIRMNKVEWEWTRLKWMNTKIQVIQTNY